MIKQDIGNFCFWAFPLFFLIISIILWVWFKGYFLVGLILLTFGLSSGCFMKIVTMEKDSEREYKRFNNNLESLINSGELKAGVFKSENPKEFDKINTGWKP